MIKLTPEEEEKAKETRRALLEGAAKVGSMGGVVPEVRGSITEPQGTLQAETSAPGGITRPTMVSPMPPALVRPGESTRVTSGVPGVTAEPASPVPGVTAEPAPATPVNDYVPRPSTAAERAGWDKSLREFREGIAAEEAKRSPTYTPTFTNESFEPLNTVPGWYKTGEMAMRVGDRPGYGVAMDSKGNITVGTPSGRIISSGDGKEAPSKEAPSAVPRPFEFSTDYKNLYASVSLWLTNPARYKKELRVAAPLLDKMAQHEINAYKESGATGSLGISPKDALQIAKDVSAIPSNIEKTKAETKKLIKETETKAGSAKEEMGLLAAALKAVEDEVVADPTTKASNAEMRKLIMARIKEILGGKTAGEEEKPPMEGATKGTDDKWYVPDPKRPGKFLLVGQ